MCIYSKATSSNNFFNFFFNFFNAFHRSIDSCMIATLYLTCRGVYSPTLMLVKKTYFPLSILEVVSYLSLAGYFYSHHFCQLYFSKKEIALFAQAPLRNFSRDYPHVLLFRLHNFNNDLLYARDILFPICAGL